MLVAIIAFRFRHCSIGVTKRGDFEIVQKRVMKTSGFLVTDEEESQVIDPMRRGFHHADFFHRDYICEESGVDVTRPYGNPSYGRVKHSDRYPANNQIYFDKRRGQQAVRADLKKRLRAWCCSNYYRRSLSNTGP